MNSSLLTVGFVQLATDKGTNEKAREHVTTFCQPAFALMQHDLPGVWLGNLCFDSLGGGKTLAQEPRIYHRGCPA